MKKKVGIISLGCPKNLIDSEIMLGILKRDNYEITNNEHLADIIIINTCGFIESAKQESINTILEMAQCKKNRCRVLIVTGCLAERYKDGIMEQMPEVDAVVGTGGYGEIARIIERVYACEKPVLCGNLDEIKYLENERLISTNKGYSYIKIAEGCDNFCTYCVIPSLRGRYRSRRIEDILKEANTLAQNGIAEIVLIAQDTTRYGLDIYHEKKLVELIRGISKIDGIKWIRLLYCYPEEIDDLLINEIACNEKVCKYLDIPIQHASDKVLKMMGRRGSSEDIKALISSLRRKVPELIVRTTIIVGFPGENDDDFDVLYKFVEDSQFDKLGVFMYSKEEGTPASKLKPQVGKKVKEKRHNMIMALQRKISAQKNINRLGNTFAAIVEGISEDGIFHYGRTYAEAPDIDGFVYFTSAEPLKEGEFTNVKILNSEDYDLIGEVTNEFTK